MDWRFFEAVGIAVAASCFGVFALAVIWISG